MKRAIALIATMTVGGIAFCAPAYAGERDVITTHAAAVEVVAADIIRFEAKEWRIANIEAPQIEDSCAEEKTFGLAARAKLAELFSRDGKLEIIPTGGHDTQQRDTALLHLNGNDVGENMISVGMASRRGYGRPLCFAAVDPAKGLPERPAEPALGIGRVYFPTSNPPYPSGSRVR